MAEEAVGIKAGIEAKLDTRNDKGEIVKTEYFFPDLGVSVEAKDQKEALKLAEAKAKENK